MCMKATPLPNLTQTTAITQYTQWNPTFPRLGQIGQTTLPPSQTLKPNLTPSLHLATLTPVHLPLLISLPHRQLRRSLDGLLKFLNLYPLARAQAAAGTDLVCLPELCYPPMRVSNHAATRLWCRRRLNPVKIQRIMTKRWRMTRLAGLKRRLQSLKITETMVHSPL